jgi:AraC-like DNA-binding protein
MIFMPHIMPVPALQPFIRNYFLLHVNTKAIPQQERVKPMPPDADQSLFFYPRSQVYAISNHSGEKRASPSSIFVAQQTTRMNIQLGEDHLIIQVRFRPGFMFQFLGKMPITEFQGKEMDAEYLSDPGMKILNEQLRETNDYPQMIRMIETYLLKRLASMQPNMLPIDRAILSLRNSKTPLSLSWLADQACLSNRQFERNFIERMGMSPKFYSRIARFDRAFKAKLETPAMDWLDVAYQCGYFDFSHLMRDFRQFAEVTPSMLIAQDTILPGSSANL